MYCDYCIGKKPLVSNKKRQGWITPVQEDGTNYKVIYNDTLEVENSTLNHCPNCGQRLTTWEYYTV